MSEPRPDGDCGGNAAPFVLGALTESEREVFLAHLSTCSVCREEVAALEMVAAALPAAAPQLAAPRRLKRQVMTAVRADARRRSGAGRGFAAGRVGRPRLALAAGAAAALLAAVAIVLAVAGGSHTRVVRAQVSAPGASGAVHIDGSQAELTLAGMPRTPPGRVYELWVKRGGAPEATRALFTVTARGEAAIGVPGGISGVRVLMVTSEPLGGSTVPSGPPSVVATLG